MRFGISFCLAVEPTQACDMTQAQYLELYGYPLVKIYISADDDSPSQWREWKKRDICYGRHFENIKTLTEGLAIDLADVTYQLITKQVERLDRVTGPIWHAAESSREIARNITLLDCELANRTPSTAEGRFSKSYEIELLKRANLKSSAVQNPETYFLNRLTRSLSEVERLATSGPLSWPIFKSRFERIIEYASHLYSLACIWQFFFDREGNEDLEDPPVEHSHWPKATCQRVLQQEREKWSKAVETLYASDLEKLFQIDEKENDAPNPLRSNANLRRV